MVIILEKWREPQTLPKDWIRLDIFHVINYCIEKNLTLKMVFKPIKIYNPDGTILKIVNYPFVQFGTIERRLNLSIGLSFNITLNSIEHKQTLIDMNIITQ